MDPTDAPEPERAMDQRVVDAVDATLVQ